MWGAHVNVLGSALAVIDFLFEFFLVLIRAVFTLVLFFRSWCLTTGCLHHICTFVDGHDSAIPGLFVSDAILVGGWGAPL